jgi:hypothetical protein
MTEVGEDYRKDPKKDRSLKRWFRFGSIVGSGTTLAFVLVRFAGVCQSLAS